MVAENKNTHTHTHHRHYHRHHHHHHYQNNPIVTFTHITSCKAYWTLYSPAIEALYFTSGLTTWTIFGNKAAHTTPNTNF